MAIEPGNRSWISIAFNLSSRGCTQGTAPIPMEHDAPGSPIDRDIGLEVLGSLESITNRPYHHGELAGHLVLRWLFAVPKN